MSTAPLTPFSYEVLALVGRSGAGPHDLRLMARKARVFQWAGESRYYTEPKRLAALGYLAARTEPGKTRQRTVYTLTDEGRRALAEWVRTPARFPSLRHEALVRLLAADLVGERAVREGLAPLHAELDDVETELARSRGDADALPHRRKYLLLGTDLAQRWVDLNRAWLADVERALA